MEKEKVVSGWMMRGLFGNELRVFFYPDVDNGIITPMSFLNGELLLITILYASLKWDCGTVVPRFPKTETVTYPIFVEGIDVRAVHALTMHEQSKLKKMCAQWESESFPIRSVKKIKREIF